jgi:hypothetical protein
MAVPSLTVTRPVPSPRAKAGTRSPHSGIPRLFGFGAAFGLVFLLLASGLAYALFRASPTITPGVRVAGLDVGGATLEQATAALDELWNHDRSLPLVDPPTGRAWDQPAAALGLSVEARQTAGKAHAVGRAGAVIDAASQAVTSLQQGVDLDPVVRFDRAVAAARLEDVAAQADSPVVPASVQVSAGVVSLVPGQDGRSLEIEATLDLVASEPSAMLVRYGFVPLIFSTSPAPRVAAEAAAAEAERLLSLPLSLKAFDPVTNETIVWSPDRVERGEWLSFISDGERILVGIDEGRLMESARAWSESLGEERQADINAVTRGVHAALAGEAAQTLVLHYRPRSYLTAGGETLAAIGYRHGFPTWKIGEFNPDLNVRAWLAPGTSVVLPPRDAMLLLPVVPGKRIVISISEQHLWAYEGDALRSDHLISTGIARSPTLPGLFQVLSHVENAYASRWDLWMPHFLGIYDALPGFTNGIHGLPLLSSGVRLWGNVLGRPASYGCIILDLQAAEDIYTWAEDGVVVEIRR